MPRNWNELEFIHISFQKVISFQFSFQFSGYFSFQKNAIELPPRDRFPTALVGWSDWDYSGHHPRRVGLFVVGQDWEQPLVLPPLAAGSPLDTGLPVLSNTQRRLRGFGGFDSPLVRPFWLHLLSQLSTSFISFQPGASDVLALESLIHSTFHWSTERGVAWNRCKSTADRWHECRNTKSVCR